VPNDRKHAGYAAPLRKQELDPEPSSAENLMTWPSLVDRIAALLRGTERILLGLTGPPGAGKSTLAQAIVSVFPGASKLAAMDGFHLSRARLTELGRIDRIGAIDTFDADGFVCFLRRLRAQQEEIVYVPEFRRERLESIAGAHTIERDIRLVVVEGNYLLVPDEPWCQARPLLDEVWYCERSEDARLSGLIARHRAYGKSDVDARQWALGPDQRNAQLIEATRYLADATVWLDGQLPASFLPSTILLTAAGRPGRCPN
jgi:pantothenate kinase